MKLALGRVLFSALAFSQPKAQLSGVVQDRSGAVVRDAAVTIVNMDTGFAVPSGQMAKASMRCRPCQPACTN